MVSIRRIMNKAFLPLVAALAALGAPAARATDVGVSISVAQPGLYGRVDLGNVFGTPVLIQPQPVVVVPPPVARPPVYMVVPPGHAKHWSKHCQRYGACGVPVYFVREDWYQAHYVPAPRGPGGHPGKGHGQGRGD